MRKEILVSAIIVGGSLVLFAAAFLFVSGRMDANVSRIESAQGAIQEHSAALESFAALKRDVPVAEKYQTQLTQLLPQPEELLGFNRSIDQVARVYGVSFRASFQGGIAESGNGLPGSYGIGIEADGSYDNLRKFVSDLESKTSRYLMRFDSIKFSARESGYHIALQGKVFSK
ncbi:MAG: hypothetical protein V1489_02445 [Candidatus Liptonbacteria bacterium]